MLAASSGTTDSILTWISQKAQNRYDWIEWTISSNLPFSFSSVLKQPRHESKKSMFTQIDTRSGFRHSRLQVFNVTLNGKKYHIFCKTVEYLGFMLSSDGIQPQPKKVRAIMDLIAPKTKKQLRRYLGMINYYREMIPSISAMLKPLTRITSPKATFMWTSTFEGVKKALVNAVLLTFPDFTKSFDIYADASGEQLGDLIQQEVKLIACYSRSFTSAQLNCTTMELELLSVVEILKEYRTMLLGFPNLIFPTENALRVKRWKLLLAEYRLICKYVQDSSTVGADALSRMEYGQKEVNKDEEMTKILVIDPVECELEGKSIMQHQQDDDAIYTLIQACLNGTGDPDYRIENTMGARLLTFHKRVMIPITLREEFVDWYHVNLLHPGPKRQYHTMKTTFYWLGMEQSIVQYCKKCRTCNRAKLHGGPQAYGKLPTRDMRIVNPFDVVHVDTIGTYGIERHYGLMVIDEASRWLKKSVQTDNGGKAIAENFDTTWLRRYPRPKTVVYDRGNKFNTKRLKSYAIKPKPILAKNPQTNAVCERVLLVLDNCICCFPDID
ncbi:LOW QUALITY PROTEIN: Retrotransposable element [Phytophthora palmivora]|uniref:Retrotransposable element n=1 Tax=Phytophthora palmivora TaxID=4796 RepID=A0A2P4WZ19_9STRA|nr:LOW QUALITY PROTEIN: Retrotransposable element [Phytophthora palmivora]